MGFIIKFKALYYFLRKCIVHLSLSLSKFADDIKIEDRVKLQNDQNEIAERSDKWQMPFHVNDV